MKYRKLGNTGLKISEIGLGSWLTYGTSVDIAVGIEIIRKAYEIGVNYFDTANVYGFGEAEKILGEALKIYPRSHYIVATKAFSPMSENINDRGLSRKHITEQVNSSLKRLGLDYIDIFYCHRYDIETPVEETLRTLENLIYQGKILYVGVSQWTASQIVEAIEIADKFLFNKIVVNQPSYNILNRGIEKEVIPTCIANGLSQIVYSPLAEGFLCGKYKKGIELPDGSRASNPSISKSIQRYFNDENFAVVEKLEKLAQKLNLTLPQLALSWILSQPNITSAIIGVSKISQLSENTNIINFDSNILNEINEILQQKI